MRTEGVGGQVVDLDKVGRDDGQLGLTSRQPHGFDDKVAGFQGRMEDDVVVDGAVRGEN